MAQQKKRTAGDDLRDFKTGKISGNYYHNGIDRSDNYVQRTSAPYRMTNDKGKTQIVSYNDWLQQEVFKGEHALPNGTTNNSISSNSSKNAVTNSDTKNNTKSEKTPLQNNFDRADSSAKDFKKSIEDPNKSGIKNKKSENNFFDFQKAESEFEATVKNPNQSLETKVKELSSDYDTAVKNNDTTTANIIKNEYKDLADRVNKQTKINQQNAETAAAENKKLAEQEQKEQQYSDKYKNSTLEQRQNARIHATAEELNWLNKHMYDNATSEELENYNKQLDKEAESLWNKRDEEQAYNRLKTIEDEQGKLKTAIDNAKLNERKKSEYNDVVDNDIKAKTVLQKYYALQDYNDTKHMLASTGHGIESITNQVTLDDYNYINKLSDKERTQIENDFKNLKKEGYDTDSLYKWYERERDAEKATEATKISQEFADNHPVLGSIASVGARLGGAVPDALKYISTDLDKKYNGGDGYINPEETNTAISDSIRSKVSENINDDFGSFLYNTGMSMADFTSLLPLNAIPGGQALSLGIMGTSAGVGAANEVIENGGTIDNAVKTGFAAGIAETLFEKVSLEQLSVFKASGKSTMRAAIGDILKGAFTEGSEEAFTDLANRLTDDAINGDLSSYNRSKQRYIEQGMSEADAEKAASWEFWQNVALDFAGGAMSGGALNLITAGVNLGGVKLDLAKNKESNLADGKAALADENFDINLLIKQGLAAEKNDRAYNLAKKMEKAIENGGKEKIEAADVGNLRFLIGREISRNPELINRIAEVTKAEAENTQSGQIVNRNTVQNTQEVPQNEQENIQPSQANSVINTTKKADTESVSRQYEAYAFGKNHPNGIMATDISTGKSVKIALKNLESSSKVNLNDEENTLVFNTTDGKQVNADSIIFSNSKLDTIVHSANEFDTYGARNYISNFEEWSESPQAQNMSNEEQLYKYNNAYSAAYNYGRKGVKFDTLKQGESSNYRILNSILGENIIKQAMSAGRRDVNIITQHHANRLTELINRNGRADTSGATVYADKGTDVSHIPQELINTLGNLATKTGRNIIISDRLADGVNGVAKDGNIYLSSEITSQKILATALHEAGHTIKKTNPTEWQTLSNFVSNYLVRRGIDIDKMIDRTIERYGNRLTPDEGENTRDAALEEIVCDTLMSLASDEKALNIALSTKQNKSKIAAAIKSLINKVKEWLIGKSTNYGAKAFAKDIEALEQLAERFSKAADTARENITEQTEVQNGERLDVEKYSIEYTDKNKPVVVITDNILKGVPKKDWIPTVKKTISNKFKNGIPVKGRLIKVNKDTGNEYTNSGYTQRIRSTNSTVYKNKLKAANNLDEIIISSTNYINEALNHKRKDNIKQFARGNVLMEIGNKQYSAEVIIGFTSGKNMLLYDLINLKSTSFTIKKTDASTAQQKTNSEDSRLNASATNMISQNSKNVNEKFSLDEEDRELVAAHNIPQKNLMNLINDFNGEGMPAPSIAIEKFNEVHEDYGDVTLLFNKDTIDPEADSRNKVYSRDAWTSMYPETEYKLNDKPLKALADNIGISVDSLKSNIFDRTGDIDEIKEKLGGLRETKNAFIKEKGIKVTPEDVEREPSSKLFYRIKFKKYIRQNNITFDDLVYNKKVRDDLLATVLNVPSVLEETQKAVDDFNQILDDCKNSKDAHNKYREQMEYNIDYAKRKTQKVKGGKATDSDIDKAVDEHRNEYDTYVDSLVSNDLFEGKYIIDEDADIYDKKNKYKSSLEYNLENVVKSMKMEGGAIGSWLNGGISYGETIGTKEFSSIGEIHNNEKNLKLLSEEEQKEFDKKHTEALKSVVEEMTDDVDRFIDASDDIVDAFKQSKTKNGVYNYLKQYYPALKKSTVDKLFKVRDEIANMPTRYFEAKPHRAVGFNEVMAAVIPADADESLKKALKEMNIPLYEYADESQRADAARKAINTEYTDKTGVIHDALKFSIDEGNNSWLVNDDGKSVFDAVKAEKSPDKRIGILYRYAAKTAQKGMTVGKNIRIDKTKMHALVCDVLQEYGINTNGKNKSRIESFKSAVKDFEFSVKNDTKSFNDAIETLAEECREYLKKSSLIDKEHFEWAKDLSDSLKEVTLVIPKSDIDLIKSAYGSITNFRKTLMGKINIRTAKGYALIENVNEGSIEDIGNTLSEIIGNIAGIDETFNWRSEEGYKTLEKFINYDLAEHFISADGKSVQSIDETAVEMAFDVATEYLKQQTKEVVADKNADKDLLRNITEIYNQSNKEHELLLKEKNARYAEQILEQKKNAEKQIKALVKKNNAKTKQYIKNDIKLRNKNKEDAKNYRIILRATKKTVAEEYRAERDKTKYRQKINTTLERLINRHLKPKPNKNVPISVVQPLYNLLSELTGNYEGFSKGVNDLTEKTGYNNTVDENGERKNTVTLSRETEQLIKAINHEISATDGKITLPPALRNALMGYDATDDKGHSKTHFKGLLEDVKGIFENAEKRGKTSLKDFSLDELERISEALSQVKNMLDKANKVVINGKEYDAYLISRKGAEELQKIQGTKKRGSVNEVLGIKRVLELYRNHMSDPIRFARMITGYHNDSVLVQMMEMLNQGQSDAQTLSLEWTKKVENELARFDYKSKKKYVREKAMEFESIDPNTKKTLIDPETGEPVKAGLTADLLVEMLLEYEDEYGRAHMMYSGYQVPNIKYIKRKNQQLMYSKDSGCYILPTEATIAQIKDYVMHNDICRTVYELCHDMYNNDMQVAVNQVSTEKYGYEIAKVKNYCPITIDDDTVYGTYADVLINRSINSRAFLHEREKFKYNRLKLKGAIGKLQSQINSVSSWCGLTMPIENFNRVYNMTRFEHEDDNLIRSVQNENLIAAESVRQKNNTPEGANKGNGRKSIKDIINRSISSISKTLKFNVKEEFEFETKPELAIEDYFKEIGGSVYREDLGTIELGKSGAKSTVRHGYGKDKLNAVPAIAEVIKNGDIIDYRENYKGNGVDRYTICAKGLLPNETNCYVAVVVKSFPKNNNANSRFYLHEVQVINEASLPPQVDPHQNGAETTDKLASNEIVPLDNENVKYSVNETSRNSQQKSKTEYFPSMKEIMKQQWGDESGKYISKLMGDLQGSTKQVDPGRIDMLTGKYIRAVLTANISSAIKQLSSYPLAAARVGWRATLAGLKHIRPGKHTPFLNRVLPDSYKHNVPYDEIAKYTPILEYRKQGNNSREMAEISKYKGLIDSSGLFGHALDRLNWIEKMDVNLVDMNYWIAYEFVKGDLKISPDSKEFMPTVAKTLEDIINNMMPNSSIMQQGQILRSKNPINRVWTICKSQVFCMVNAAMDASGEYNARLKDYKTAEEGFKKEQARTEFKVAQKKLARTYSAILVSTVMTCGMLMPLIAAIFGKWDRYRDEDGNITPWSIGSRMLKDLGSEMSGMFLYGDTVYNAVLSIIDRNEDYYGISLPGIDTVNDLVNGIINIARSDSPEKLMKNISSLVGTLGMMTGLPTKNLMNLWQGASNHFTNFTKYGGTPTVNDYGEITMQMYANYCYEALMDGDEKKYAKLYSEWLKEKTSSGKQVDKSYIKSKLKTELEDDKEIITAGNAFFNGDLTTYENTVEKYAGLGFDKTTVVHAINSVVNDLEEEQEKAEGLDKYASEKDSDKEPELYSYSDAFDFLKNGDTESYQKVEKYLMENKDKSKTQIKTLMQSASRTDPIFKQYIEASKSNDADTTHTLYTQLLNIYGSESKFKSALKKYQDKVKKQESK